MLGLAFREAYAEAVPLCGIELMIMGNTTVQVRDITKSYQLNKDKHQVLKGLSFAAATDKITVLLGKSGCGKTTLLRLLCGLEEADSGEILMPKDLKLGVMFQEARLMPWLTCAENIALGLPKDYDRAKLNKLLETVGLKDFAEAYPKQMSGGMQQRAALARTLATESQLILMDEPFAALDYFTRLQMQQEVLRIKRLTHTGAIFVTHNIDEALALGDKILVMQEGSIAREIILPEEEKRDVLQEPYLSFKKEILDFLCK